MSMNELCLIIFSVLGEGKIQLKDEDQEFEVERIISDTVDADTVSKIELYDKLIT